MTLNVRFFMTVFLPFALGYYLSYFFRVVNGVIATPLQQELGIGAGQLGLISSAYFLFFAAAQLPLGVALDRYDTRRVASGVLLIAAAGSILFAMAQGAFTLWLGRGLIGLGVSACLMSAFRAYVATVPSDRLPFINGLQLTAGGLGAITATAPAEWLLPFLGWRGLFIGLAVLTLIIAALVRWRVPPLIPVSKQGVPLREQMRVSLKVFADPRFLRVAPASVLNQATLIALLGLWAAVWLRDVTGLDSADVADVLFWTATGMAVGYLTLGSAASALARRGLSTPHLSLIGMGIFLVLILLLLVQAPIPAAILWAGMGYFGSAGSLMYAALTQQFPQELAGRVTTALNLVLFVMIFVLQWVLGLVIGLWQPDAAGHYPVIAFQVSFGGCAVALALSLVWYLWRKPESGRP